MAQTIKLKRSATAGNEPTTSQLSLGELGINTTDGKVFLKKSVGGTESIVEVGGLPLSGGTLTGGLSGTTGSFSGALTTSAITAPSGFLGGSNGGLRIHSGGTKFFNITAGNAARDGIMDIGASDARFKDLWLSGSVTADSLTLSTTYPKIQLNDITGVDRNFSVGTNNETFTVRNETAGSDSFTIYNDNNATFSGTISSGAITSTGAVSAYGNSDTVAALEIYSNSTHGMRILHRSTDGDFSFERRVGGTNTEFLRIGRGTGNATFSGSVTSTGLTLSSVGTAVTTPYNTVLWRDSSYSVDLIDQGWSATLGDYLVFNAGGASPSVNVSHYLGQSYADFGGYVTAPLYKVGTTTVIDSSRTVTADGTASSSAPKYTFSGDTNTGLGYIGTDAVGLIAAGSRKFYVNGTNGYFQNLSGGVDFGCPVTIDTDNQSGGALRIEANQTNPEQDFYFAEEIYSTLSGSTTATADREQGGLYIDLNSSATGGDTSNEHRAYGVYADVDSTGDADLVVGIYGNASATPTTGTTSSVMGGYFFGEDNGGAGAVTNVYGLQSFAFSDNSTSDANWLYGLYTKVYNAADSGNIGGSAAVYGEIEIPSGTADIYGNSYVFRAEYDNNGTVAQTNSTYLFYGNYAGVQPTTAYGLYIADAVTSHFGGGNLTGVGNLTASGTVTANSGGGNASLGSHLDLGDNQKARFGASDDLEIYHDGSNSIIKDSGTGILRYTSSNASTAGVVFEIENTDSTNLSGSFIHFKDSLGITPAKIGAYANELYIMRGSNDDRILTTNGGAAELYYSDDEKLATTSTGIDVDGTVTADKLKLVNDATDGIKISRTSGASENLYLGTKASAGISGTTYPAQIEANGCNILEIYTYGNQPVVFGTNSTEKMRLTSTGLGIGRTPAEVLDLKASSGDTRIRLDAASGSDTEIKFFNAGVAQYTIGHDDGSDNFVIGGANVDAPMVSVDKSGNVGIGTSSTTQAKLNIGSSVSGKYLYMDDGSNGLFQFKATTSECIIEAQRTGWAAWETLDLRASEFVFKPNNTQVMRLSGSTLDIGRGTVADATVLIDSGAGGDPTLVFDTGATNRSAVVRFKDQGTTSGFINYHHQYDRMDFGSGSSTGIGMSLDSGGNLLVGKTSSSFSVAGIALRGSVADFIRDGNTPINVNRLNSDGALTVYHSDGTNVGSIGTSGDEMYLGKGDTTLLFNETSDAVLPRGTNGAERDGAISLGSAGNRFNDLYLSGYSYVNDRVVGATNLVLVTHDSNEKIHMDNSGFIKFETAGSEAARLTSSGTLLLKKTSTSVNVAGGYIDGGEAIMSIPSGANTYLVRNTSNYTYSFYVTGAGDVHASGGISVGDAKTVGHRDISLKYDLVYMTAGVISPADDDGSDNDNSVDLGKSAARFNDIYATNSSIQTSDRNEKQDIEELSDAEQRVAVACKSLLRKFRWKSAVEEKGEDARIHFGIIAQDLQNAFEAEGLDAGRYAMFISTTWTNEDGEEQTRMGVRYSELLAFIISAI